MPEFRLSSVKTRAYANQIYRLGTQRLTARDGYSGVGAEYYTPVEQYAAANFYPIADILYAFNQGWINQQEYDETMDFTIT